MHEKTIKKYSHSHSYKIASVDNEKSMLKVIILTTIAMIGEIVAGTLTGSMALLADGWHMGTHSLALGVSYLAYILARKYRKSKKFTFGTGKFGILAGYTSALFLGAAAIWMIFESVERIFNPLTIAFDEAILVAILGFVVNIVSIFLMHSPKKSNCNDHLSESNHSHSLHHDHTHEDHNFKAAYLHVIADTLTSILAIVALFTGRYLGWFFLDPVMGIIGGLLICVWAFGLLRSTSIILVDGTFDQTVHDKIKELIEGDNDSKISDIHLWRISPSELVATISIVTGKDIRFSEYLARLEKIEELAHVTVEVIPCQDDCCNV